VVWCGVVWCGVLLSISVVLFSKVDTKGRNTALAFRIVE